MEETFFERLVTERNELSTRTDKLHEFVNNPKIGATFYALDATDQALLQNQLVYMQEYLAILNQRIGILS